jgi:DNA segregation ATPase FtsK/SpoIIIE, S-DNA-T family
MTRHHDDEPHDGAGDERPEGGQGDGRHEDTEGLATVHYLTSNRSGHLTGDATAGMAEGMAGEVSAEASGADGGVLVGRVVTASEYERSRQDGRAVALVAARGAASRVRRLATHDRTVRAGKAIARHGLYVPAGAFSLLRRGWESRTTARYERMMRAAEAAGNAELLADWQHRAEAFKAARHDRFMGWLAAPVVAARSLLVGAFTVLVATLVLGALLASARKDWHLLLAPYNALVSGIAATVEFVAAVWDPALRVLPWLVLVGLWNEGRRRVPSPAWLATSADADVDMVIDEATIARALLALRIPAITAALKLGPLAFTTTARRDGRGTHAVVRLPVGVTADRVAKRRADLATGLYRLAKEVWPTTGSEEGILDLWVADKGALAEGAGPYPLLTEGVVDVFKGVPFGKTLRGDPVLLPIIDRNTLVGGMPGQGKSSVGRDAMAGAALDWTCELRIWVPDANYDFEAFKPRCSVYVMGAEDAHLQTILAGLRDLHAEVQTRGDLLVRHQVPSVTRALAEKGIGLHPVLCLLEEAHVMLTHKTYGPEASQLVTDIVRLCRKRGIHLILSTQAPTANSIPRDVTRNCSNGIAFAVGDHTANDALLGQGAYKGGHRATELIPGTDAGTAVVKGVSGQRSQIVQCYFLDVSRSHDQVTPIITRSLDELAARKLAVPGTTPGATGRPAVTAPVRDLLVDLAAVLGADTVPTADAPALLAKAHPTWAPYAALTGKALREILADQYGVKVPSTGNRYPIDPTTIRDALARRALTIEPGHGATDPNDPDPGDGPGDRDDNGGWR